MPLNIALSAASATDRTIFSPTLFKTLALESATVSFERVQSAATFCGVRTMSTPGGHHSPMTSNSSYQFVAASPVNFGT
nr:hypothetical protein [Solirubrobacter soli]